MRTNLKATAAASLGAVIGLAMLAQSAPGMSQSAPAKKCAFYEHFDYGGRSFQLHTNHVLAVGDNISVKHEDARRARGDYQKFVDPSWAGTISSVKPGPNCTAQMNFADGSGINVQKDAPQMSGKFNDSAVYVSCSCR